MTDLAYSASLLNCLAYGVTFLNCLAYSVTLLKWPKEQLGKCTHSKKKKKKDKNKNKSIHFFVSVSCLLGKCTHSKNKQKRTRIETNQYISCIRVLSSFGELGCVFPWCSFAALFFLTGRHSVCLKALRQCGPVQSLRTKCTSLSVTCHR